MTTAASMSIAVPTAEQAETKARAPRGGGRWYVRRAMRREVRRTVAAHLGEAQRDVLLVDLGCGDMPYRDMIEPCVGRYVGFDLPENKAADASLDESFRATLTDGEAGVVWSTQVLEHVPDPAAYLAEAWRLLPPGGKLVLSTHGHWKFHPHPGDYWRWTSMGLRQTVEQAGFEVAEVRGVMGLGAAGVIMFQDALVSRLPRKLRWLTSSMLQGLCAVADRLLPQAQRDRDAAVYFVVAVKQEQKEQTDE